MGPERRGQRSGEPDDRRRPVTTASVRVASLLPEPGQAVEVRGSTWAVANIQAQGLPRSPADEATAQLSHVVDLQSLNEDRLNETLSVVWELEVGHTVALAQGLPDRINPEASRPAGPGRQQWAPSGARCALPCPPGPPLPPPRRAAIGHSSRVGGAPGLVALQGWWRSRVGGAPGLVALQGWWRSSLARPPDRIPRSEDESVPVRLTAV